MKSNRILSALLVGLLAATTFFFTVGCSPDKPDADTHEDTDAPSEQAEATNGEPMAAPENRKEAASSAQAGVDAHADEKVAEKRKQVIEEAVVALLETRKAVRALNEQKPDDALAALEKATGKLDLVLARDPSLALAPVDVAVSTYDLLTTPEAIKKAKEEAEEALEDGKVQQVAEMLAVMKSEIVVSVTNIPLATYLKAIKAVAPLIDAGKNAEAKAALARALNTLLVTKHVIPLPIVRAGVMLKAADALAEKADRDDSENEELANLLQNARYQLHMGKALGYGDEDLYEELLSQVDEVEKKTEAGKSGRGFFKKIEASISKAKESVFD